MIAYLVRRYLLTLLLAPLLLFSILVYGPDGVVGYLRHLDASSARSLPAQRPSVPEPFVYTMRGTFHLNKPWPWSYTTWLFDPKDPYRWESQTDTLLPSGIQIFGLSIPGSGVLTGDFGPSTSVARAVNVDELFGPGLPQLILVPVALIVALSLLVTGQRIRRGYLKSLVSASMPVDRCVASYGAILLTY